MNVVSVELSKESLEFDRFLNGFILTGAPNRRWNNSNDVVHISDSDSDFYGNNIAPSRYYTFPGNNSFKSSFTTLITALPDEKILWYLLLL